MVLLYQRFPPQSQRPDGMNRPAFDFLVSYVRHSPALPDPILLSVKSSGLLRYPVGWPQSGQKRALTGMTARQPPQVVRPGCSTAAQS